LGGDLVHGCIKSSRFVTFSAETRIGLGAAIFFSWLSVRSVLETGGGVLSRGTPLLSNIISRYDFVIHGPFIPSLEASAATI
jgi:hypothetical protein